MSGAKRVWVGIWVGIAAVVAMGDGTAAGGAKVILDCGKSFWKSRTVWETEQLVLTDGTVDHVRVIPEKGYFRKNPGVKRIPDSAIKIVKVPVIRLPATTREDWHQTTFDDSVWIRDRGPLLVRSRNTNWSLILRRGRFEVPDPRTAGELEFSMRFHGGAIVYLNGREIAREGLPAGKITTTTAALPYPKEAYLTDDGWAVYPGLGNIFRKVAARRVRRIEGVRIPSSMLRKGVNVLAVAVHRAPLAHYMRLTKTMRHGYHHHDAEWCRAVLFDMRLTAAASSTVVANTDRIAGKGFQAWNHSVIRHVWPDDYPDPFSPLSPVRMTAVRGGTFSGQVVLGDDEPITGLAATVSGLSGPSSIPASAVTVRWGVADGASRSDGKSYFDSLEDDPPAEVPVYGSGGAIQPVRLIVTVPADAKAGDYRGAATFTAEGVEAITVPIELRVIDWALGDFRKFDITNDIVQSPESVAMAYGVELWSEAHWKLLDRTFALMAPLSARTIYITCIRRTHFGNEHAMVRWARDEQGELQPDFALAERYLDLAIKHLGKIPGVVLYAWSPTSSMGHASGTGSPGRTHDRPILITLKSGSSGRLRKIKGPAWGSPESKIFWRKLTGGFEKILEKRGMAGSMLLGLAGDNRPTKQGMDDLSNGIAEPRWAIHSHYFASSWQGYKMGFCSAMWGVGCVPTDPAVHREYGWKNPFWLVYYPRELSPLSPLVEFRTKLEKWMGAASRTWSYATPHYGTEGTHGLGRLGADFWKVLKDKRGRVRASLAGRYPETYWGQLNLNYCVPHLLGKGRNGAVPTVRSEALRESIQEMQARIFVEKAILAAEAAIAAAAASEDASPRPPAPRLSAALIRRARAALDKRIRIGLHCEGEGRAWFIASGWNRRSEELFGLAAEIAKRLGG